MRTAPGAAGKIVQHACVVRGEIEKNRFFLYKLHKYTLTNTRFWGKIAIVRF